MSYCKKAVLFLFAIFMLIFAPLRSVRVCAQDIQPQIYLEGATDSASGIFILKVMISPRQIRLCGLEVDITYDPNKMMLCSCERGDALKSLEFDCSLKDGRIRLLFFGEENSEIGGRIATLCFLPTDYCDGEIEFRLSLPTKNSAIYFEDDKILPQNLSLTGLRIDLGTSELSTDSIIEGPTELPSDIGQEYPSAEAPTEDAAEKTEPESEYPSDTDPPKNKDGGFLRKTLGFLLVISTAASGLSVIPMLFPRVFRKGYF